METKGIEIRPDGTFQEWTKPCPECGNTEIFRYRREGPHIGAYCAFCDGEDGRSKWLGWVKQWTDKDWARYIKERDKYVCQICGEYLYGREAHAHHLIPQWMDKFSYKTSFRYDTKNGICLCNTCHKRIHGKAGTIKESED